VSDRLSRKSAIINLIGMPIAVAAAASVAGTADAGAMKSGTTPQASVMYVAKSTNGKYCKGCKFYFGSPTKAGGCSIVAGSIAPMGYCVAYAAKS
jgi:hypothetical protein